ncbi:MAG: ribonuclease P protein component [Chloroflexi bacterium]|nr:ribonuclease P protein component [Chloroflexota bacterium]
MAHGKLAKNWQFQRVFSNGKSHVGQILVLYALPNAEPITRVGIAPGKKIGGSVVRNRLKRTIREAYRRWMGRVPGGYDLILIPRGRALQATFEELVAALGGLLMKAGLLQEEALP